MATRKKPAARPISSFDDLDAAGIGAGWQPMVQEQEVAPPAPEQDGPMARGVKQVSASVGLAGRLAARDFDGAAQNISDQAAYRAANPGSEEAQGLMRAWQQGDGILGGIKGVAGEFADDYRRADGVGAGVMSVGRNLQAMGSGLVEQVPNMALPMVGMIGGGAAGSAAGPVGTVAGGWAGASAGNALVGTSEAAFRQLEKAGVNPSDAAAVREYLANNGDAILGETAIKGGVIGAVDVATAGLAHWLLSGPGKMATTKALTEMGVDMADKAAVKAATKTPAFKNLIANDATYQATQVGAQKLLRNTGAAATEPVGEFAGEYGGSLAATGEADAKDAFLEAASSLGQSGIMFAGQKAIQAIKSPAQAAADQIRATETLPESGALTKAVNAGVEAKAQAIEAGAPLVDEQATAEPTPEPVDDPVRDQILALPDGARQDALRAYAVVNRDDVAKGVLQYNRKLLDRLLAENQPAPVLGDRLTDTDMGAMLGGGGMMGNADPLMGALGMNREAQANSITNVAQAAQNRPPMPASDAVRMLDEARNRGLDLAVAEHPAGGFVIVPPAWITPDMAAQGEARLNETIARMQQADAAPVERTPRTRTDGVGLNLQTDPVQNYLDNLRSVNTPAARAYVRDFDAGRITPADVQQRMQAERGLTPEQRIARAAAEAPAQVDTVADRLARAAAQGMATPAPTDILNPAGEPFKTRMAADRAAKKTPGAVVPVEGGFVVRPQEPVNVQDVPQAPEVPQAAPVVSPPGQAPQAVGAQPAGPAAGVPAEGAGAVEAAGVSVQLEDALFKERDATTSAIENDWMNGNGRRRLTNIERAIHDAVTASTLDADSAAQIIETALENDRPDLAQYAASRAMRAAKSMDTTPGIPQSSPKYGKIKSDLEARKKQALDAASALQEIVNSKQAQAATESVATTNPQEGAAKKTQEARIEELAQALKNTPEYLPLQGVSVEQAKTDTFGISGSGWYVMRDGQKISPQFPTKAKAEGFMSVMTGDRNPEHEQLMRELTGAANQLAQPPASTQQAQAATESVAPDAEQSPAQETTHNGTRIYPTKIKVGDEVKSMWAVESPDNQRRRAAGERTIGGDSLHDSIEQAKAAAEREAKRDAEQRAAKAEQDAADKARLDAEEARKAANRPKTVVERRKDAILDGPSKIGQGTKRAVIATAVDNGYAIEAKMVYDHAAKKRDQEAVDRASRAGYILGVSNENLPLVKAGNEAKARLKEGKYEKPEYRVYQGSDTKAPFREITKTEYDYAQELKAQRAAAPQAEIPPASATHTDPGQAPEAATPAVVTDSLKKAARNEDTKPSEMRKWLVAEIDKELLQASDRPDYDEAVKRMGEKDAISWYTGNGPLGKNNETGYITFDVPGDGKYKVRNSVRGLLEFRKNVMASQGFKDSGQKRVKPEQNDGAQGGSGGNMAAITNMIEEGDFEAARDYAEAVGVSLEDVKVPKGERKTEWEMFRKTGFVPRLPDTRPQPAPKTAAQVDVEKQQAAPAETNQQAVEWAANIRDESKKEQAAPAEKPAIPEGYKPAGEPFYRGGKQIQGYAPFTIGERVTMKDSAGQSGVIESLASPDDSGVFASAVVKFDNGMEQMVQFGKLEAAAAQPDTPKLTPAEAKSLMAWEDLGQKDGVKTHALTFYESQADKDAKRGRMIVAKVSKGDRSATAWMVDGEDKTFGALAQAKKLAEEVGMAKAVADGFVEPEAAPASPQEGIAQAQANAARFEIGKSLTKEQRKQVLDSLVDVYKSKGAEREFKGQDGNGNDRYGYAHSPDLFEKSDITGAMVRYYVTLPDGRIAHPTELFQDVSASDIERMVLEQEANSKSEKAFEDAIKPFYKDFDSANLMAVAGQVVISKGDRFAIIPDRIGSVNQARQQGWELAKPAPAANPAAPAAPISDFGEKLEGARKDMPPSLKEEVSDEKIASLPLSKIWPSDAHESIEDDAAAALVFAARQEIPAKPRVPSRVRAWVEKVKTYRTLVKDLGKNSLERIEQLSKEKGFHSLDPFFAKVRLLSQLPRDTWSRVERVEEYPNAIRYEKDGSKTAVAFSSVTIDGKSRRFEGVGKIGPDEVQAVKEMLGTAAPKKDGLTAQDFEVRGTAKTGYKINRKGDSEYRPLKIFTGEDAAKKALAWRDEHTAELEAAWEAVKARDNVSKAEVRRDENRERTGENRRNGRDVTAEMFTDAFGFRGGQFGNWVGQGADAKSRQGMLNDAYDALLDLSDILGIPSRAISLNGTLGLSFGARGSGKAAAHFEPSNLVINLTKTRGAGSLAHEWFHALDNYFSRMRGGEVAFTGDNNAYRQNNFVTYKPEAAWGKAPITPYTNFMRGGQLRERLQRLPGFTYDANKTLAENAKAAGFERDPNHKDGVRPQVEKAFADLVQALNESPMAKRASSLDKAADGYWGRIIERGARSFENYVISKMAQRGWSNDFLANIRSFDEWMAMGKNAERYPYLKPEEDAPVVAAFDKLFQTVETKEDDTGNVVMFSFAGARAATADTNALVTAQDRLNAGEDAEAVRKDTGWFKGNDGKWRFEIDDSRAFLKGTGTFGDVVMKRMAALEQGGERKSGDPVRLGDVLHHESLFAAYPALRDMEVQFTRRGDTAKGRLATDDAGVQVIHVRYELDNKEALSVLLHEIQHGIQTIEGFATGGTPKSVATILEKERFEAMANRDDALTAEFDALKQQYAGVPESEIPQEVANRVRQLRSEINAVRNTGWREASNPFARRQPTPEELFAGYTRLAGEVEARNTQSRQKLTAAQRRATAPGQTADVADADVIVVFNGKEMANAPMPANAAPDAAATAQPLRTPASTIRAAITKAYGKLLGQLESKGLVTLTQTQEQAIEAAAQARADKTGQPLAEVRASLMGSVSNSLATDDLDIRRSANGAIQGFFDPQTGQSFLVADNLTAEAAPGVLMHEVGIHMAADGSMKALFNRAAMMLKLQRGNPFMKAVQARMDAAGETSGEEAAAYIAEAYENDRANAPASVQRWLADLLAAVKAWMFKKGIMGADRLTVADIAAVARANAKTLARGYVTRSQETAQQAIDRAMTDVGFSRTDDRINFSRAGMAAQAVGDAIKSVTVTNIKKRAGFKLTDYLGLGLQALGRRQIVDIYGDMLPLAEYNRLVTQMEADKNEGGAEADKLVTRWAKLDDEAKLADLMHDATLAQIDPDKPYADGDDKGKFLMLERKFKLLSDEAKAVYRDTRDAYKAHHEKVRSAIKERIERSELKGARKAELLQQMDSEFFAAVKGVYFPLARFGQYVVTVKGPDGKVESVSRAETMAEADALRTNLLSAFPRDKGFTVGRVMLSKEFVASRDAVGRGFMTELYQVLDKQDMDAAQRAELEDTLGQLYLSSLPDLSWAKHGIHRKGTPGFSQDARRAFAQNMFHGARYLAKLRYSDLMQDELTAMQKHVDDWREVEDFDQTSAQRVVDEMNKRHESLMNPKSNPLSTALTSLGFVFHLGLSPASAMVNLSQTALVAYPIMGAKWGFGKASAALLKASAEAAKGKNDITASLNADERAAYDEAVRAGTIDVTMAHDLAGIAQGEDAGVMWKIRPVMRYASFLFHHAERFNRQVTFVAAYRLAREAGADQKAAFEQATKATYDGHFDYGAANRPRIMQGNVAKVLLLFKQYGQNMVYTLARNAQQSIKGESPEVRAQARKALGGLLATHAAAAGVLGLPMVTTLLAAASMIGGDDDEPWDAKVALQNMLADTFGQKPAEVLAHGLSRLTPWDISGKVGLDRLIFPDVQEGLEGQRLWESAATQALGPVGGIFGGLLKGADLMSDGHYKLGLEAMLPAVLRQAVKSVRYAVDGAQDKTGVVIKDEVSMPAVVGQLLGFSPSEVRLAQEGKSAVYQQDRALGERRQELLTKAARATMAKDAEARAEAMKEIQRFNQKNPTRRITPLNVLQSVRNSQRRIDQAEGGIYLPKSRRDAMNAGRFAMSE